jgi:outer membrane biogenesis lipoprotein LolB
MVDRLRAWELCLWIDGRPAPDTDVLVEQASRVVLYVHQGNTVRLVDPDPQAALN